MIEVHYKWSRLMLQNPPLSGVLTTRTDPISAKKFDRNSSSTMTALIPHDAVALGIGAFCGALSRYHAGRLASEWIASDPKRLGQYQAWHTAAINVSGSFLLGCVSAAPLVKPSSSSSPPVFGLTPRAKLLLGVGFCGSFTTFSTYSVDVVNWLATGNTNKALSYILTNNVGGFVAAGLGMALVKKFFG